MQKATARLIEGLEIHHDGERFMVRCMGPQWGPGSAGPPCTGPSLPFPPSGAIHLLALTAGAA